MKTTLGQMPTTIPPGYFKAVSFPVLALLDQETGDHRLLDSSGAGSRDLPLTIRGQFKASFGHEGAEVTGALFEVTIDPEAGIMSGRGFLLNDEFGRRHARMIHTKAMASNSVDLADVKARYEEDFDGDEYAYRIRFTKFNLAATTGVATPAFAEAYAELEDGMSEEELTAALGDPMEELVAECPVTIDVVPEQTRNSDAVEIVASGAAGIVQEHALFFVPEAEVPTKITVNADGHVFGHLGLWESCHDGFAGQCVRIPRPTDSYASFNKPGVLTERGIVETGMIFAYGGHDDLSLENAYGGIENAWCDVRVSEGRLGPWISGIVRPGVADEVVYAARASRISGHWKGGKLKAIVSVNAEGFDVPGSGFSFQTSDDGVLEMVASFPPCFAASDSTAVRGDVPADAEAPAASASAAAAPASGPTVDESAALLMKLVLEDDDDE